MISGFPKISRAFWNIDFYSRLNQNRSGMGGWIPGICCFTSSPGDVGMCPGLGMTKLLSYMITSTWMKSSCRVESDPASWQAQATRYSWGRRPYQQKWASDQAAWKRGLDPLASFNRPLFPLRIWMSFCSFQKYQLLNTYYVLNSEHNRNVSFFTTTNEQPLLQIPFSGWGNWGTERQVICPKWENYYVVDPGLKLRPAAQQSTPYITMLHKFDQKKKKKRLTPRHRKKTPLWLAYERWWKQKSPWRL